MSEAVGHTKGAIILNHEALVEGIESLTAKLRPLLPEIEDNLLEFHNICAELRGFAFHAFRLEHDILSGRGSPNMVREILGLFNLPKPEGFRRRI